MTSQVPNSVWARLADFPDYAVSWNGQIMRVAPAHGAQPGRILTPSLNRKGYVRVKLSHEGFREWRRVHRLVAKTFLPNPDNLPEVNHMDFDKTRNDVDNLEWVTGEQNREHYYESRTKHASL